jgi:hypothetical protein
MPRKKSTTIDSDQLVAIAREGLLGVAREGEVGDFLAPEEVDGVWIVRAKSLQPGYPGWLWTVTVTPAEDGKPTITEVHLLPGDEALLSAEWVPWSERLEEYRRLEAEREALEGDSDTDDDDDDDQDVDDLDDALDGIDIDQLDIDLDPSPLEVPEPANDVFDHIDVDDDEADGDLRN